MTKPFETCRVKLGSPLKQALQSLDDSALGIVLVEETSGRVVGTLTDGDVRRAFLKGATMTTPLDDYIMRTFV